MGIHDEPAQVRLLEDRVETGDVAALGQPDTDRIAQTKVLAMMIAGDENLRAYGIGKIRMKGRIRE